MGERHQWTKQGYNNGQRFFVGAVVAMSLTLAAFEWTTEKFRVTFVPGVVIDETWDKEVYPAVVVFDDGSKEEATTTTGPDQFQIVDDLRGPEPTFIPDQNDGASTGDQTGDTTPSVDLSGMLPEERVADPTPIRAEIMPYFQDCFAPLEKERQACTEERFRDHLKRRMKLPGDVRERGVTTVTFVVNEEGQVTDVLCTPRVKDSLNKEIARVLHGMPVLQPGTQQGHPVRVYYQIQLAYGRI